MGSPVGAGGDGAPEIANQLSFAGYGGGLRVILDPGVFGRLNVPHVVSAGKPVSSAVIFVDTGDPDADEYSYDEDDDEGLHEGEPALAAVTGNFGALEPRTVRGLFFELGHVPLYFVFLGSKSRFPYLGFFQKEVFH